MNRLLAIGLVFLSCPVLRAAEPVVPGQEVPNLANVRWIQGTPVEKFKPGRIYVLEFWSTWCGACVQSIGALNESTARHQADVTFIAVHIWQRKGAPTPGEFIARRLKEGKPVMACCVAEDVGDAVAKAWMSATENSGLPTAMIIDRESRLAWMGHSRDLETPLAQIATGKFDQKRATQEMTRRIRVSRLASESDAAIDKKEYERGVRMIMEALHDDPATVVDWIPSTYGHLLAVSRSPQIAGKFVEGVLATDAGKRKELLIGLARAIVYFQPKELRDLDLALTLSTKAEAMSKSVDSHIAGTLAEIQAERGDIAGAIVGLKAAMDRTPDASVRRSLGEVLEQLQRRSHD